jgi:Formin Homology 2 Domain
VHLSYCRVAVNADSRLLQKACEETMNSSSLRKILGLVLYLGNVVNTNGTRAKEKAAAIHLSSLLKLQQAKAYDRKTSFLEYAARVLHRTNPGVAAQYRLELGSLSRAANVQWSDTVAELAGLDEHLKELRQMALQLSSRGGATQQYSILSEEEETRLLHMTSLGRFAVKAGSRMISVHAEINAAKLVFDQLVHYFGEAASDSTTRLDDGENEGDTSHTTTMTAPLILSCLAQFCSDLEVAIKRAEEHDKAKVRELRRGLATAKTHASTDPVATSNAGGTVMSPSHAARGIVKARAKPKRSAMPQQASHPADWSSKIMGSEKAFRRSSNNHL